MALLDMARKQEVYLEVAHMNYHHRDSADRDEKLVRAYCRDHGIRFHKADFCDDDHSGNFQDNARKQRYAFFAKLCCKNHLDEVLIGHNLDDLIETYLMQKKRNLGVSYYGIKERNILYGVNVFRPLLKIEKQQLERYCLKNKIRYGIDESNLSDIYTRNKIRHETVEKMSSEEKKELYEEICIINRDIDDRFRKAERRLKGSSFSVDEFIMTPDLELYLHRHFLERSDKTIKEMIRQLKESRSCAFLGKDILLVKEYDHISKSDPIKEYEFVFKNEKQIKYGDHGFFRIERSGNSFEGATLKKEDFPITIRNFKSRDKIRMRYGSKAINRFFIDRKIGYYDRKMWPIVLNRSDEVILVPGIGCDINHYSNNHNFFVIK